MIDVTDEIVKMWCQKMDVVFEKYSKIKTHKQLENDEALAVLLGMDLATLEVRPIKTDSRLGFEVVCEAKHPLAVTWNGEKMVISHLENTK